MRLTIVFLKSDKSTVASYVDNYLDNETFLPLNGYDTTHDAVTFETVDPYAIKDYEVDIDGNAVLTASADANVAARIKDAFSTDQEFKILKLAFKSILDHAAAGTLNTHTLAQLANDIEADW